MFFFEPRAQVLAAGPALFRSFTSAHLLYLVFCVVMIVVAFWWIKGRDSATKEVFLSLLCLVLPISQAFRIAWEVYAGVFRWIYSLPFQVCSSMAIITLLYHITKNRRFLDYLFIVGVPMGSLAIIFPNLNGEYPVWYYYTWQYFFHHALFILIGLTHVFVCGHRPRLQTAWFTGLIVAVLLAFDATLNHVMNSLLGQPMIGPDSANYAWISFGAPKTPLVLIQQAFGQRFYLVGVLLCAAVVVVLMYTPFVLADRRRGRRPALEAAPASVAAAV